MLQKIILGIAIFLLVLLGLTFGEAVLRELFSYLGFIVDDFASMMLELRLYLTEHWGKALLALIITIPLVLWIASAKKDELERPTNHRKIAIVLAVFLGWVGAHRFYLGQIGWGLVFLVLFVIWAPLAYCIALIDALRYAFMGNDEFKQIR
ncbi:TM2 domain-containing protein [Alcaligenes sp. SDU_A2]|uniref:TM2 domain-containing protein n=1 Tax=Alcaligenes sp. SDU_A2 TaxID=3136634 RepID=UPI002CB4F0A6|nr:NINE protein [Alcaligenes sp.]HRL25905.1 NINE protein [Alcaligenes sp.]